MKNFTNKVAVVTGAGSGMGRYLAVLLAKAGANVAICEINPTTLVETEAMLKDFSVKLGVPDNQTWHFVTGDKDEIYEIGSAAGYMVPVGEDADAPGGYIHSGAFILVDQERRIRGFYDGTKPMDVTALINDIPKLLAEYE